MGIMSRNVDSSEEQYLKATTQYLPIPILRVKQHTDSLAIKYNSIVPGNRPTYARQLCILLQFQGT